MLTDQLLLPLSRLISDLLHNVSKGSLFFLKLDLFLSESVLLFKPDSVCVLVQVLNLSLELGDIIKHARLLGDMGLCVGNYGCPTVLHFFL